MRDRTHSHQSPSTTRQPRARRRVDLCEWRACVRPQILKALVHQARDLSWSRRLGDLLLEELHISDDFDRLIGRASGLPRSRDPQLLALALVIRHSWCPQDLARVTQRLGLSPSLSTRPTNRTTSNHAKPAAAATAAATRAAQRAQRSEPSAP
jgi:hypothetical protein